jgi:IS4 transposase
MPLRTTMSRLFPRAKLERLARESGAIRRRRLVDVVALFWTLMLTLETRSNRSIADLRRAYAKATGTVLAPSAFYDRLSTGLARMLKSLVQAGLEAAARTTPTRAELFDSIRTVLCVDSTVVRLHDALARAFPACRTNHTLAAAKLHTVLNVQGCGPQRIKITAERVHDGPVLRAGTWVRGLLLLFDLGYYRYQLFAAIHRQGGFFVTRLKEHANPTVLRLHRAYRGNSIPVEGGALRDFKGRLQRQVFDADVEIRYRSREYLGTRRGHVLRVRLVGLLDETRGIHHWYLTNLDPEIVPAEDIGKLYAARWTIELLFRELKGRYHLESMPSRRRHVVEIFLYAAVLTVLLSRALLHAVQRWGGLGPHRTPFERWARLFVSAAATLLTIILDAAPMARLRERMLLPFLAKEAADPNVHRELLLRRAGLQCLA